MCQWMACGSKGFVNTSRTLLLERVNDDNFLEMADKPIGCVL